MTIKTAFEVKSIMPASWMGPDVFHVTSTSDVAVLMQLDHHGWHACSSREEVFDGGAIVAGGRADMLEAAAKALAMQVLQTGCFSCKRNAGPRACAPPRAGPGTSRGAPAARAPSERNRPESASSSILPSPACPRQASARAA